MSVNRRRFCAVGAVALSSPAIVGGASAQSKIEVTGTIRSKVGADVAGVEFRLSNVSNDRIRLETTVDSSGEINLTLPETGTHRVTIFDVSPDTNRIPVIYSFNNINIGEDGDIGEFVIPEAYQTDIQIISDTGDPIEDLPVNFRAENGTGLGPGNFTTDSDGFVKYGGSTERGVELSSPTEVEVHPPGTPAEETQKIQTLFVTEPTEFKFKISNPEQYTNTMRGSDSTDSGVSGQRGLFSNNPSGGGGALSNPTNLTTLGFLLSVGGIAYQLVGGR